ncbi:MAG: cytochrome P460 family protein [Spirochaetaceae bacterium]
MKLMIFITLSFTLLSCSNKKEVILPPISQENISGTVLWNRITNETDYNTYSYMPGQEGLKNGQSPHGVLHKIFANKILLDGLPAKSGTVPYGSIIVKENYTSDEELDKLTVMVKVKDYNPEAGDWFWAAIKPNGEILAEGTPKGCLSCHSGVKYNDYIVVKDIRE